MKRCLSYVLLMSLAFINPVMVAAQSSPTTITVPMVRQELLPDQLLDIWKRDSCFTVSQNLTRPHELNISDLGLIQPKLIPIYKISSLDSVPKRIKAVILAKSNANTTNHDLVYMGYERSNKEVVYLQCPFVKSKGDYRLYQSPSSIDEKVYIVTGRNFVYMYPSTIWKGKLSLDGKDYIIWFKDLDCDKAIKGIGDGFLGIDYDGNGVLAPFSFSEHSDDYIEQIPIYKLCELPDGNFYKLSFDAKTDSLKLERDATAVGDIKIDGLVGLVMAHQKGGAFQTVSARPVAGHLRLPFGTYKVDHLRIRYHGKTGKSASVLFKSDDPRSAENIVVDSPGPVPSKIGQGLNIDLKSTLNGNTLAFDMSVFDKTNLRAIAARDEQGNAFPRPQLNVYDENNNLMLQKTFEYG